MTKETGGDVKPYSGLVEGRDKVTSQARRPNVIDWLKSKLPHKGQNEQPPIAKQVRPMTTAEKAHVTRNVLHSENDPDVRGQLAKIALRLRRKAAREQSFRRKVALTAAAVGTGVVMTTAPAIGQGISKVGEAVGGAAQAVGQRLEQSLDSPEPSIEMGKQIGASSRAARRKEADLNQPPTTPIPTPTPPLWERPAVTPTPKNIKST